MFYIFFNGWVTFSLVPSKRGGDYLCRLRLESGWAYWYWQQASFANRARLGSLNRCCTYFTLLVSLGSQEGKCKRH